MSGQNDYRNLTYFSGLWQVISYILLAVVGYLAWVVRRTKGQQERAARSAYQNRTSLGKGSL